MIELVIDKEVQDVLRASGRKRSPRGRARKGEGHAHEGNGEARSANFRWPHHFAPDHVDEVLSLRGHGHTQDHTGDGADHHDRIGR